MTSRVLANSASILDRKKRSADIVETPLDSIHCRRYAYGHGSVYTSQLLNWEQEAYSKFLEVCAASFFHKITGDKHPGLFVFGNLN